MLRTVCKGGGANAYRIKARSFTIKCDRSWLGGQCFYHKVERRSIIRVAAENEETQLLRILVLKGSRVVFLMNFGLPNPPPFFPSFTTSAQVPKAAAHGDRYSATATSLFSQRHLFSLWLILGVPYRILGIPYVFVSSFKESALSQKSSSSAHCMLVLCEFIS
jgi:hypothetical protein